MYHRFAYLHVDVDQSYKVILKIYVINNSSLYNSKYVYLYSSCVVWLPFY